MSEAPEQLEAPAEPAKPEAPSKRRLFIGLMTGEDLGAKLLAEAEHALGQSARKAWRFPRPDRLHLTLLFLGDVLADTVDEYTDAIDRIAESEGAPELSVEGTGVFPDEGPPRVLWLGVSEEGGSAGRLEQMHAHVIAELSSRSLRLGRDSERALRPHITVARPRKSGRPARAFRELELSLSWRPTELVLVESLRGKGPARYEVVHRAKLAAT